MHRIFSTFSVLLGLSVMLVTPTVAQQMTYEQALGVVAEAGIVMRTKSGVPNIHRGRQCWVCHVESPPETKNILAPQEPCGACHQTVTAAQERIADRMCRTHPTICPVILRYQQPDGSMNRFFFGLR